MVYFVLTVGLVLNLRPSRLLLTLLALIAAPCLATAGPLGPNLVQNGSFETGDFSSWTATGTCEFVRPQLGTPPGTCGYIAIDSGLGLKDPKAFDGTYAAYIGAGSADTLSQSISTTQGGLYDVAFSFANTEASGRIVGNLKVYFDGALLLNFAASPWYAIDAYSTYHFTGLQASGSSALLSFVSNRDSAYFLIDNVSVNQEVPEPTTLALLGVGLAGAGGRRWWQRRKVSQG